MGEVVGTSEAANAVLESTLGYPRGRLPAVVEPLGMLMVRAYLGRYRGRARPTDSSFQRVSRDAVDLWGDFPTCIGSGTGLGGTTIGSWCRVRAWPSPNYINGTVLTSCSAWSTWSTINLAYIEGALILTLISMFKHTFFLNILFPRFSLLVAHVP